MSKFIFVCQEESMPFVNSIESKRTVEFNADGLHDIITEFENFLRGCGFHFEGQLDFVYEDSWTPKSEIEEDVEDTVAWQGVVNSIVNPPSFRAADLTGKNS